MVMVPRMPTGIPTLPSGAWMTPTASTTRAQASGSDKSILAVTHSTLCRLRISAANSASGEAAYMARVAIANALPLVRLVAFSDIGWAAAATVIAR